MSIRIILAEDHVLFAGCLSESLSGRPDMAVVAEVADGREAVVAAEELNPDLVIMDISMPGMNGIEATRMILAKQPTVKVLCLSMHADDAFVAAVLDAGASGYALKDTPLDELIRAIHIVMAGETYLSPAVASIVAAGYASNHPSKTVSVFTVLTSREREVLQLMVEGHCTKAIATQLHVSVKTVGTHREHLMSKLGVHDLAGLTKYAIREGLTSVDPN